MSDSDIFREAIDIIAAAPTGQGSIHLGGVPAYNERYSGYATRTLELLRDYLAEGDEIAFAALPDNKYADSDRRWGANIRVHQRFRTHSTVVAVLLLHEGCHLLREVRLSNPVEQEVICRTLSVCLYRDLIAGVTVSRPRPGWQGRSMTIPYEQRAYRMPAREAPIELTIQNQRVQANRLVDWVIASGYAAQLTAPWIVRSLGWWGGLGNREPTTKGHYLRCLARAGASYGLVILHVLESLMGPTERQDWDAMTRGAAAEGGINDADLQRALRPLRGRPATAARMQALERHFPVDLGFGGAGAARPAMRSVP